MNDETQQTDAGRLEKEEIEDLGTVTLARGGHVIHCLTVIGQIEGHSEAPQGQKTTKYEHVIPQLERMKATDEGRQIIADLAVQWRRDYKRKCALLDELQKAGY